LLSLFFEHVKEVLLQQKSIYLFGGDGHHIYDLSMKEFTCFLRNVLIEFSDNIYIIYIIGFDFFPDAEEAMRSNLTDTTYLSYCPWKTPDMPQAEMEGIPLLNLLQHDAIRFWTCLYSLKEKMYKRDDNERLKRVLQSIYYDRRWMILIDKDGETFPMDSLYTLYRRSIEKAMGAWKRKQWN